MFPLLVVKVEMNPTYWKEGGRKGPLCKQKLFSWLLVHLGAGIHGWQPVAPWEFQRKTKYSGAPGKRAQGLASGRGENKNTWVGVRKTALEPLKTLGQPLENALKKI